MDALHYNKHQGPTSVRVPLETRKWMAQRNDGITLASIIRYGPSWRDRMEALANENSDLKTGVEAKDKIIQKLYEQNNELLQFKTRTTERIKKGDVMIK